MVITKNKNNKSPMNTATLKSMDYNWSPGPEQQNNQEASPPRAVFVPHSNSLPFEERNVTLEQPVKIGRNVYRTSPCPTNTIFDCRVLSRHHATLYYDKGHFYLVDNQSSNGTFINNNRCPISKTQEPHEVFSGDVVQFGISVVENAGNTEKHTFPPVVAQLKLFHPDGSEAKQTFIPTMATPLHLKELYQLNNYVQEAIQRESSLQSRLRTLRECVERTRAEAQSSWELFVGEQRLLQRVHTLENMLAVGKQPELHHVTQLLDDKKNYQEVAQESLRAAHEQRLALEESLERRSREVAALHQHNCALRLAANNALSELQKLAARCERKMCAARLAISAAEDREAAVRSHLPLAYSVQNGEARMLVLSTDSNLVTESKRGALDEAVRTLPDYIKLLLPQALLAKLGISAISAEGKSAKEFELILKSNNIYDSECKEKQDELGVGSSGEEKSKAEIEPCTDDEKQSRLQNEGTEAESISPLDGDLKADNNANSTYSDNEDSPNKGSLEYANVLRVMSGLNDEIKALRERLTTVETENEQLRNVRDELLAASDELRAENLEENEDASTYKQKIIDLQAQLSRCTVAEEANLAEIQRMSHVATELQAELAFRPTCDQMKQLTVLVADLTADLQDKKDQLASLTLRPNTMDTAVGTESPTPPSPPPPGPQDLDDAIDSMFQLGEDDEEDLTPPSLPVCPEPALTSLHEELVLAKERWEEVNAERARLAAALHALSTKPASSGVPWVVVLVLPVLAAVLVILLPQLS